MFGKHDWELQIYTLDKGGFVQAFDILNHNLLIAKLGAYGFGYAFGREFKEIKHTLYSDFEKVKKWIYENYMVLNQGKCHFMCVVFLI